MITQAKLRGWGQDQSAQNTLLEIINNPTFKRALDISRQMMRVPLSQGENAITDAALSHALVEGAELLLDSLEILTNPPKDWSVDQKQTKQVLPFEWLKKNAERKSTVT